MTCSRCGYDNSPAPRMVEIDGEIHYLDNIDTSRPEECEGCGEPL